jgi:hypothetical protein
MDYKKAGNAPCSAAADKSPDETEMTAPLLPQSKTE